MQAEGDAVFVVVSRNPDLSKSEGKRVICERIAETRHQIVLSGTICNEYIVCCSSACASTARCSTRCSWLLNSRWGSDDKGS